MVRTVLATVVALVSIAPRLATAQAIDPAAAILLEHSEVESMLGGFREGIAAAQAAGDFFVLVGERTREAAHRIAAAKDPTLGAFEAISDEEWAQRSQSNFMGVVVSFLHRYESVSDELMAEALEEWKSDAGVWYVRAYSEALGETAVAAGVALAAEIRGSGIVNSEEDPC